MVKNTSGKFCVFSKSKFEVLVDQNNQNIGIFERDLRFLKIFLLISDGYTYFCVWNMFINSRRSFFGLKILYFSKKISILADLISYFYDK